MGSNALYLRYAKQVKIFKGLQPEEVGEILKLGAKLEFHTGKTIFHEGMLGTHLFVVLSGEVAIYKQTKIIAKCTVGDTFGEMAVLNHRPRSATAAAVQDTTLFTLDEKQINAILDKDAAVRILLNIVHVLSERLEIANSLNASLGKP